MAVAASILTAIYHMLKDGTMYQDLGCNHFDRRSTDQQKNRLVKRLTDLLRCGDQATRRLSRLCGTALELVAGPCSLLPPPTALRVPGGLSGEGAPS